LESFVYPFKSSRDQKFTDINPDMSKDKFGAWKAGDNILESFPMSCGPAALSTILTYYLKRPTTEREIMRIAGTNGDSYTNFEQLARAAAFFNIRTKIVQLNTARLLQQLTKSNTPIIALIYVPQGHFVDVIGREGENLLISDPYSGNRIITVSEFTKVWFGSALIIEK
jgi:predicted double-glycine peptidase